MPLLLRSLIAIEMLRNHALSACRLPARLITVPAHYGSFPPLRPQCCCALHAAFLHILRKTSARPNARGPAGTARSGNKSLVRKKRTGKIGIRANAGGSCSARRSLGKEDHMAKHTYATSPPNLTGMPPGVPVHHRQRSGGAVLLLRHEIGPDCLHGALPSESVGRSSADE